MVKSTFNMVNTHKYWRHFFLVFFLWADLLLRCTDGHTLMAIDPNEMQEAIVLDKRGTSIYTTPNIRAKKIGTLKIGEKVTIKEKGTTLVDIEHVYDYWFRIEQGKSEGWVFGGSLYRDKSINIAITSIYENDAEGIRPILVLNGSGVFFLRQNECQGLIDIIGEYTHSNGLYAMKLPNSPEMQAETQLLLRRDGALLRVEQELVIKNVKFSNYRSLCAPLLNSTFKKLFGQSHAK